MCSVGTDNFLVGFWELNTVILARKGESEVLNIPRNEEACSETQGQAGPSAGHWAMPFRRHHQCCVVKWKGREKIQGLSRRYKIDWNTAYVQ